MRWIVAGIIGLAVAALLASAQANHLPGQCHEDPVLGKVCMSDPDPKPRTPGPYPIYATWAERTAR